MYTDYTYQDWQRMGGGPENARRIVESYKASAFFHGALMASEYFSGHNPTLDNKYLLKVQTKEERDEDGFVT